MTEINDMNAWRRLVGRCVAKRRASLYLDLCDVVRDAIRWV
jgi:hypothetical protein